MRFVGMKQDGAGQRFAAEIERPEISLRAAGADRAPEGVVAALPETREPGDPCRSIAQTSEA